MKDLIKKKKMKQTLLFCQLSDVFSFGADGNLGLLRMDHPLPWAGHPLPEMLRALYRRFLS